MPDPFNVDASGSGTLSVSGFRAAMNGAIGANGQGAVFTNWNGTALILNGGINENIVPASGTGSLWLGGLVYGITKALWQESTRRLLDGGHPAGKRIRIADALTGVSIPLHPGAARYYQEAGLKLPQTGAAN